MRTQNALGVQFSPDNPKPNYLFIHMPLSGYCTLYPWNLALGYRNLRMKFHLMIFLRFNLKIKKHWYWFCNVYIYFFAFLMKVYTVFAHQQGQSCWRYRLRLKGERIICIRIWNIRTLLWCPFIFYIRLSKLLRTCRVTSQTETTRN